MVLVGKEKKDRIMSKEERRIVSYHEVGHALISALQKNSEPVQKITIVPRTMGALGYVMHVPEEEKYLNTEAELRDMLVSLVGGRAAEEIVFETVTTGAANDIEALNCSDSTAAEIDAEVVEILKESYDKALNLLRDNRDVMDKLAEFLIEKETITGKEFMEIFRKEKGLPEPEEKKASSEENDSKTVPEAEQRARAADNTESESGSAAQGGEAASESSSAQDSGLEPGSTSQEESSTSQEGRQELEDNLVQGGMTESESTPESAYNAEQKPEAGSDAESNEPGQDRTETDSRPVGRFSNGRID